MPLTEVKSRWLSEKDQNSLRQILNNFFTKSAKVIVELRSYSQLNAHSEQEMPLDIFDNEEEVDTDYWFSIGTDATFARANLISQLYLWTRSDITTMPPLVIETVYDLTGLGENHELYIDDEPLLRSKTKKKEIVLERWLVRLDLSRYDNDNVDIKGLYNKIISFMRCLYTLLGLLPAYELLLDRDHGPRIKTHILDGSQTIRSKGRFGLQKPLTAGKLESDRVQSKSLSSIMTPIGELETSVSYRVNCNFHLETIQPSPARGDRIVRYNSGFDEAGVTTDTTVPTGGISTAGTVIAGEHASSISPTYSNMRFRASSTSINSISSKRKPSGRGLSFFKTGSIASSSPPPAAPAPAAVTPAHTSSMPITSNVHPIPVMRNDSTSASSGHFFYSTGSHRSINSGTGAGAIISPMNALGLGSAAVPATTAVSTSASPNNRGMLITSVSSKYPSSSLGSRFKVNSIDNTPGSNANLNVALQGFRFRNKLASSLSDAEVDITGDDAFSLPGNDDDLSAFMKMLDSKPDLRVSTHSSIFNVNSHGNTSVNEESMMNFRNMRKHNNEFFANPGTTGGMGDSLLRDIGSIGSASVSPPPLPSSSAYIHTPPTNMALARRTFSSSSMSMDFGSKQQQQQQQHLSPPKASAGVAGSSLTALAPPPLSGEPMDSTVRLIQEHSSGVVRSLSRGSRSSRGSRGSFGVSVGPMENTGGVLKAAPVSETSNVLGTSASATATGNRTGSVSMLRRMSSSGRTSRTAGAGAAPRASGSVSSTPLSALRALSYGADVFASDGEEEAPTTATTKRASQTATTGPARDSGTTTTHEDLLFEMSDVVR